MLKTPPGGGSASLWELPEPALSPSHSPSPSPSTAPAATGAPADTGTTADTGTPAAQPRGGTLIQRLEALEATVADLLAAAEAGLSASKMMLAENDKLRSRLAELEAIVGA